jgi:TnpA family transposase
LTSAQISELLALPTDEPTLIRHYTLSDTDLAVIQRRRRPHKRLGFALQLCTLRYRAGSRDRVSSSPQRS